MVYGCTLTSPKIQWKIGSAHDHDRSRRHRGAATCDQISRRHYIKLIWNPSLLNPGSIPLVTWNICAEVMSSESPRRYWLQYHRKLRKYEIFERVHPVLCLIPSFCQILDFFVPPEKDPQFSFKNILFEIADPLLTLTRAAYLLFVVPALLIFFS